MKTFILLITATALYCQETRREIVNAAPTPAEDAKANSDVTCITPASTSPKYPRSCIPTILWHRRLG